MLTWVVTILFTIVLRSEQGGCVRERIRGGRSQRQSLPGRYCIDYKCNISDIDNNDFDNFDIFEKGEPIYASDYANNDMAVSMILGIANIISVGDNNDDNGSGGGG